MGTKEENEYIVKRKVDGLYQIIGKKSGEIIIDNYKTRVDEDNLMLGVSLFYGKDIKGYLDIIEENFSSFDKDGSNIITDTLKGAKTKKEIDVLETECFLKGEFLIEEVDYEKQEINLDFVLELHKLMFEDLYEWAGKLRIREIRFGNREGVDFTKIRENLIILFDDINFRIEKWNKENLKELAIILADFEYRFVSIHPFYNTNGRMGRLLTNVYLLNLGRKVIEEYSTNTSRKEYLKVLREYDDGEPKGLEKLIYNLIK